MSATIENILELTNIVKEFPGVRALDNAKLSVRRGEVHGLVGENGAGKSTLMNVIDGVYTPDAGEIYINGRKVEIKDPLAAQRLGIGFVHQEIALCPDVTVAENLYMAAINSSKAWLVNYKELYAKTAQALESLHFIDPQKNVGELSISNQQVVEIATALSRQAKVLILDEPTNGLDPQGIHEIRSIIQKIASNGTTILLASHLLDAFGRPDSSEVVFQVQDREQTWLDLLAADPTTGEVETLLARGVDGIVTDLPGQLAGWLAR